MTLLADLARLPEPKWREILASLTDDEAAALAYDWPSWARPNQLPPPGDWRFWLYLAGRGAGKTRSGAEWVRAQVQEGRAKNLALVAPTANAVRTVMIEGDSGIMKTAPPWFAPSYEPSKLKLTWPNGAVAHTYSAEEPERLRGANFDSAWADELAAWEKPDATWEQLTLATRIGDPRIVITTTPKPIRLVRELLKNPHTVVTRGSSYENRANLAAEFFSQIITRYEGTRLGRQELNAEILDDTPGALWTRAMFERDGFRAWDIPPMTRMVVAIDPAVTATEESDETGLVLCGRDREGQGYVMEDASLRAMPDGWARRAVEIYQRMRADAIIAEANNGGEMVAHTIKTVCPTAVVKLVHASRGKRTRAEPISAMYEQGRIRHVGIFEALEEQMVSWTPDSDESPDRMDALVWGLTELFIEGVAPKWDLW